MAPRLTSFEEFWPYYVSEHRKPGTRALHMAGTALVLTSVIAATVSPWWLLMAPLCGYGFAWTGHFFVEKNRPATFAYPLWSLRGDFRMFRLTLLGKMEPELERARKLYPRVA